MHQAEDGIESCPSIRLIPPVTEIRLLDRTNPLRFPVRRAPAIGLEAGWLIAQKPEFAAISGAVPRCLQLATGQWCLPDQATWFPAPGPAICYATDLGHEIGQSVEIIYRRRNR